MAMMLILEIHIPMLFILFPHRSLWMMKFTIRYPPLHVLKTDPTQIQHHGINYKDMHRAKICITTTMIQYHQKKAYSMTKLPEDIIIMIWTFSTQSINTIKFGIVKDKLHHIYDDLVLSNCKRIVSTSGVLKLTVLNDLILDNNSEIRCDFGVVVLLIYGDLCIKRDSQIVAEGNGNIYIKTFGSLVMESSTIRTYNAHEALKAHEGNIDIKIEKDVKMTNNARMESGDIKIECDGSVQMDNVYLTATRNNICVKAKEELNVDMKWAAEHMSARMYKLFVLNSVMKIVK
eukprot:69898_1